MRCRILFLILCVISPATVLYAQSGTSVQPLPELKVNWPEFMAAQDMVFDRMPTGWTEGPFMGNGMIGTMVYQTDEQTVRWDVGRSDYYDHRFIKDKWQYMNFGRLPVGYFNLNTVGKITDGLIRLDLWNAEARGTIHTDKGKIAWRTLVHADLMVIVVEIEPSVGEADATLEWQPLESFSPRYRFRQGTKNERKDYVPNPPQVLGQRDGIDYSEQPLLGGGQTATAWKEVADEATGVRRLFITIEHTYPQEQATEKALQTIQDVLTRSIEDVEQSHRSWWHAYYPKSFLSLPDAKYENFYWAQLYKLASASRPGRALPDLTGPWLIEKDEWPGCWWNMNMQVTFSPVLVANHSEIAEVLAEKLDAGKQALINNSLEKYRHNSATLGRFTGMDLVSMVHPSDVGKKDDPAAGKVEMGCLPWILHNYYMHYRHTMDEQMLRDRIFPLLRRSMNYYMHFLSEGDDERLHLVETLSPEYGTAPDANYDLALLRWGCQTLIDTCNRLEIDDPLMTKWEDILARLTDYPANEQGYMIGRGVPYKKSHRHWSHPLMIYPLYLVNTDRPETLDVMQRSVDHWFDDPKGWMGFSYPAASSIMSSMGHANRALECLDPMLEVGASHRHHIQANTLYHEWGHPVIETPLGAVRSIQDMLIQSWGDKIRVFPAAPDAWPDIEFHHLSAEGAFLVSGRREGGKTIWLRIKSLAGEPCRVATDMAGDIKVAGVSRDRCDWIDDGLVEIDLKQGEEILLYTTDSLPDQPVSGVSYPSDQANQYGLRP